MEKNGEFILFDFVIALNVGGSNVKISIYMCQINVYHVGTV